MIRKAQRQAGFLAFTSGTLLLAAHFSAASRWGSILGIFARFMGDSSALQAISLLVVGVASLGGILVILGGMAVLENRTLLARLLILLGTGSGLVSFAIFLALALSQGSIPLVGSPLAVTVGLGMSIVARIQASR